MTEIQRQFSLPPNNLDSQELAECSRAAVGLLTTTLARDPLLRLELAEFIRRWGDLLNASIKETNR